MGMRITVMALLFATTATAGDLQWEFDGYPRILKASKAARDQGKRILVGMSGAPS